MPAPALSVLCCSECHWPLTETSDGGYECQPCGFAPSLQDVELRRLCPHCYHELDAQLHCPKCQTTWAPPGGAVVLPLLAFR